MHRLLTLIALCVTCVLAQPARIVSTSPSITETLFAIGAGPRVVGVSTYCKHPPAAQVLPKVGTYRKPDAERIALLRPDLVLLNETATDLGNRLDALGIRHLSVPVGSLRETFDAMRAIGEAVGRQDAAAVLITEIETLIERNRRAPIANARTLLIVGKDPDALTGLVAAGPTSYLGELLTAAGGANVLNDRNLPAYPRISLETVMRLDPDVIIDAGAMGDRPEETAALRLRVLAAWKTRGDLRAVKRNQVHPVFSSGFTIPGPRMVEVLQFLRAALEGKAP